MADELKTETTQTDENNSGQVVFNTQADFDAVIQNRLAKEKAKYTDYDETKAQLETLRAKEEERRTEAMSELEKAQAERDSFKTKFEEVSLTAEGLQTKQDERDEAEKIKIETSLEGLDDIQKNLINQLPLYSRMGAIEQFKPTKPNGTGGNGKGARTDGVLSIEEISKIEDPKLQREAYGKYRNSK